MVTAPRLRSDSAAGRWVVATTVLGSAVAMLTATVVNVALPAMADGLDADAAALQWIVNGYLLTLASLILVGGALGDRYGRRRVYRIGVAWFAVASLLCAVAPSAELLVVARVLQGVGGALLTPGSLAIIEASFHPDDRSRAIGAWSGLGGIAGAVGPLVGGLLVDVVSWRAVFLINVPVALAVVVLAGRFVPESRDGAANGPPDIVGALTGAVALGGVTYALIEGSSGGAGGPVVAALAAAVLAAAAFVVTERRVAAPMLPRGIFADRQFGAANLVTFVVYGALGGAFFLVSIHLQVSLGYSPLAAGAAQLPITLLMLVLSSRAGALAHRIGPRRPLTFGPATIAAGLALYATVGAGDRYLTGVLPAVVVFGLGLSLTVAPVTSTALAAADEDHAGAASGVNNAVARAAQLLAVAALPALAGLTGDRLNEADGLADGFPVAMRIAAGCALAGGAIAWLFIRDDVLTERELDSDEPEQHEPDFCCPIDGPVHTGVHHHE
ncbi:MAG: MFS transporter [Actinomycetota bacterium]|nr:MFS transporter [Actinomycetota bacterium]